MKEIALKESDISKLKKYPLDGIIYAESEIYYLKREKDWSNSILLKKLHNTKDENRVNRKIETIKTLQESELTSYKELVIPTDLVTIGGIKSGFTIKEVVDSTNLCLFLQNEYINASTKIDILKKIGELLRRVQSQKQEFYFGDLQEYNFLVGKNGEIYVVDLDSSAVNKKAALESKYIIIDRRIRNVDKYNITEMKLAYPSNDIDIFCYNSMVLNYISGIYLHRLEDDEYYEYLEYLKNIGIPEKMIDIYINHYTNKSNESVVDYLDEIPSVYQANYSVFKALKKKKEK